MNDLKQASEQQLMQRRRSQLAETLSVMRQKDNTDVVLQCGEQEYRAHRIVLEASSPYFILMFRSGMKEATSGRVVFQGMEPDTLDAILDFIYLGKVDKLLTTECIKDVLAAAHLLELDQLTDYCLGLLVSSLSVENFLEVWNICDRYEKKEMQTKIMCYLINNLNDVLVTTDFLHLTLEQLKDLINYFNTKLQSVDDLLVGTVRWLQCDLELRTGFAQQLLTCFDVKLLSKECLKTLLQDKEVMASTEIASQLNEMAVTLFVLTPDNFFLSTVVCNLPMPCKQKNMKIGFFSENNPWSTLQLLDIQIMTWLPSHKLCVWLNGVAACFHKQNIFIVGGSLGSTYVKYDVEKNSLDYIGCSIISNRTNAGVCVFQDRLFIVGGLENEEPTTAVHYTNPGGHHWYSAKSLTFSHVCPTVLASSDHIFVAGGTGTSKLVIEYSVGFDQFMFWETITIPVVPENVSIHFLISKNTLYGYYYHDGHIVRLTYNKDTDGLQAKVFSVDASQIPAVTGVYQYPDYSASNLFVSTIQKGPPTPNFIWEPEHGKWTRLPPTKGKCDIPETDAIHKVFTRDSIK